MNTAVRVRESRVHGSRIKSGMTERMTRPHPWFFFPPANIRVVGGGRMDRSAQNSGTMPVRSGLGFETAALEAWMKREVDGFQGPLAVEQFRGGQSNPTYKLVTPARAYVLRRK